MASIFEPTDALGSFHRPEGEYQVNVDPTPDVDGLSAEERSEVNERSFRLPVAFFVFLMAILAFRLVNLQITQGQLFSGLAKGNRVETRRMVPPRGVILDRNGATLVKNVPLYHLNLYPAQLPKEKADRETIYQKIEEVTGIKAKDIIVEVDKKGLRSIEPITLRNNLDRDTALLWQVKLGFMSGLLIDQIPTRSYQSGLGLAHTLGYVGKITAEELERRPDLPMTAIIGKSGLELAYDKELQGREGKDEVEVDSKGQIQRVVASEPAVPGHTLTLHVDKELQQVVTEALAEGAKQAGRRKAAAIAMDPETGGILALVSLPEYDNNLFVQPEKRKERQALFDDKDQPLFNRAVNGLYPPGSTVKPLWAAAGLHEGLITEKTDLKTPAEIKVGQSVFPDWKPHGHADVKKAIAESNNIFFYALAGGWDKIKGLGPAKMKDYATKFGWNQKTEIDLPSEVQGTFPDPDWKKKRLKEPWYIGDTYHMGIGQGYMAISPLQLIRSINAVANNGTLYQPRIVKEITDSEGKKIEVPSPKSQEINMNDATFRIVREGMRQTILEGSATPLKDIPMPIAGKTGTAQFEEKDKTHAWFVGFAPYDKPTISLLVMVEGGGESFSVAVPIAKKILTWYSDHRYQKPAAP